MPTDNQDQIEDDEDTEFNRIKQSFGGFTSNLGITRSGTHLYWGYGHGALMNQPRWVKNLVVTVWNHVACFFFGHDLFGPIFDQGDETVEPYCIEEKYCVNCCKEFALTGAEKAKIKAFNTVTEALTNTTK